MKLFNKTLYIFIALIVFQSTFTIIFVTRIIKKSNIEDLREELESDSAAIYDGFHSWKRSIWKSFIDLKQSKELKQLLAKSTNDTWNYQVITYLAKKFSDLGFDSFIVKGNKIFVTPAIMPLKYQYSNIDSLNLENERDHPYIRLVFVNDELLMIGVVRIFIDADSFIDIFIIEHINEEFCSRIIVNKRSKICVAVEDRCLCGNWGGDVIANEINLSGINISYREFYNVRILGLQYGLVVQKIDRLLVDGEYRDVFIITGLSDTPYVERLSLIRRTVLYVSLISALLTILLSFFLTNNITHPIRDLLMAMYRIKDGDYSVRIKSEQNNEIGELFNGFSEMAEKLYQDKLTLESYIKEITFLKDYNETILHSIKVGIAIINDEHVVEKANSFFFEFFNLKESDIIGKVIDDFPVVDSIILKEMDQLLLGKRDFYSTVKRYQNSKRVFEIKLYPFHRDKKMSGDRFRCVLVVDDISKKIEFEEKIFQAEKLSSIGMLSAGVAHEVNNPLSSIMTNIQNLIEEEENQQRKVSLKLIEKETRRIARIVKELLEFSSSGREKVVRADANRVIDEVISLISYSLERNKIVIEKDLTRNLPLIAISEDELKQVIINLIKNSLQAIKRDGKIIIATRLSTKEGFVLLSVNDDGMGITKEVISKIFDPFFTTKSNGEGTGLGLSVVYGIVNKYKGNIKIKSKPGKGTEVLLEIPVLGGKAKNSFYGEAI